MNNHFIGLRLSANTAERLATNVERLRAWDLPATWVNPEDYHITLAFLGPMDDEETQLLPSAIDLVASSFKRPQLELVGIGARAGRHEPRSVFAAIGDTTNGCRDIHDDLIAALALTDEKPFQPHVTLCRPLPMTSGNQDASRTWQALFTAFGQTTWGNCECEELALYSRSENRTTRYQILASWSLIK